MLSLKLSTVSDFMALSGNKFQSLMVLGKNEFLNISVFVAMILICWLCPVLDGRLLKAM